MKKVLLILALMLGASTATFAQSTKDVLYLKNGSVIYGQLIENGARETGEDKNSRWKCVCLQHK